MPPRAGPFNIALERRAWLPPTVLSTHCYVLAGACLDGFIAALEADLNSDTVEPVDIMYRRLSESRDVYMLRQPVALQVPSYSDVEREQTDYRKVQAYTLPEYPSTTRGGAYGAPRCGSPGSRWLWPGSTPCLASPC